MLNWIKAHKFSIIYFVSFFMYPFTAFQALLPRSSFVCVVAAGLVFLFQLIYIIWLRRKENVSLGRSIARFFLYLLAVPDVMYVCYFVNTFFNGYNDRSFWGEPTHYVYYGFEAWAKDEWNLVFFGFTLFVFVVYLVLYLVISAAIRKPKLDK